jgi:hypothetical protein
MFDSVVGIISLCIALAQAAVLVSNFERKRTFALALGLLLVILIGYWTVEKWRHHSYIESLSSEITVTLSANRSLSLEQIAQQLNENRKDPVSSADLDAAIEYERSIGYICSMNVSTTATDGRQYTVRVYSYPGLGRC